MKILFSSFLSSVMMLSVMFAASSCTEDEPVTPPVPPAGDPEIAFTQDRLEIPIEGGEMSAAFTLSNPVEDIEPSAACEADWITGIVVDTAGSQVGFTAAENDGYEEKRAELILTYGNLSDTLILVQEAAVGQHRFLICLRGNTRGREHDLFYTGGGKGVFRQFRQFG